MTPVTLVLLTLGDPSTPAGGYLYHRRMADLAPAHGMRIAFQSVPAGFFPLTLAAGRAALDAARRLRPAAILLDSLAAHTVVAAHPASMPLPMIGVVHQPPGGMDHGPMRRRVQRRLDLVAYARCAALIAASDTLAESLAAAGLPPERITVVPPGADLLGPSAQASSPHLHGAARAAFLCVASWQPRKGLHLLLEALGRLPPETLTLHLVGLQMTHTRYGRGLAARIAGPDLRDRVVVHGPLARERLAGLYAGADAFVLPSLTEPYGTVYGEALAAGLPVIGFRAGNLPNLIHDGQEGILVPPGDVRGLADALERMAADHGLRARMAAAAAAAGRSLPTWEDSAARFFEVVRSHLL